MGALTKGIAFGGRTLVVRETGRHAPSDHGLVGVELLVMRDCPHAEAAGTVLARALTAEGLDPRFTVVLVDSVEEAQGHGFVGSPSFMLDGRDLFPSQGDVPALACRVYRTDRGLSGVPDEAELRMALKRALADQAARRG
ncbi:MAG TPA: hypothetical protein VI248_04935 [Kineosporiaceae bacterium]